MTLRELINRLEELSHNGSNDYMSVEISGEDEEMAQFVVKGAYIEQFNNAVIFDESNESYDYVGLILG